jgi:hypothetical protein
MFKKSRTVLAPTHSTFHAKRPPIPRQSNTPPGWPRAGPQKRRVPQLRRVLTMWQRDFHRATRQFAERYSTLIIPSIDSHSSDVLRGCGQLDKPERPWQRPVRNGKKKSSVHAREKARFPNDWCGGMLYVFYLQQSSINGKGHTDWYGFWKFYCHCDCISLHIEK